jgi:hypothetical protein
MFLKDYKLEKNIRHDLMIKIGILKMKPFYIVKTMLKSYEKY